MTFIVSKQNLYDRPIFYFDELTDLKRKKKTKTQKNNNNKTNKQAGGTNISAWLCVGLLIRSACAYPRKCMWLVLIRSRGPSEEYPQNILLIFYGDMRKILPRMLLSGVGSTVVIIPVHLPQVLRRHCLRHFTYFRPTDLRNEVQQGISAKMWSYN